MDDQSITRLLHYLLHCVDETQQGRNRLSTVACNYWLSGWTLSCLFASLFSSLPLFGWNSLFFNRLNFYSVKSTAKIEKKIFVIIHKQWPGLAQWRHEIAFSLEIHFKNGTYSTKWYVTETSSQAQLAPIAAWKQEQSTDGGRCVECCGVKKWFPPWLLVIVQ